MIDMGGKAGSTESAVPVAGDLTKDETPQPIADTPVVSAATRDARRHMAAELEIIDAEMYEITFEPSLITRLDRERQNEEQLVDLLVQHITSPDAVNLGPVIARGLLSRGSCDRGYGPLLRGHGVLTEMAHSTALSPAQFRYAVLVGGIAPFNVQLTKTAIDGFARATDIGIAEIKRAVNYLLTQRVTQHVPHDDVALPSYPHVAVDLLAAVLPRLRSDDTQAEEMEDVLRTLIQRSLNQNRTMPFDLRVSSTSRLLGALTATNQLYLLSSSTLTYIDEINDPNRYRCEI